MENNEINGIKEQIEHLESMIANLPSGMSADSREEAEAAFKKEIEKLKEQQKAAEEVKLSEENIATEEIDKDKPVADKSKTTLDGIMQSAEYSIVVGDYGENTQVYKNLKNGNILSVERPDANNYVVSAKDANGNKKVADKEDLINIIKAMQQDGKTSINLGNIKSHEFLDRIVAAAQECNMPINNLEEKRQELLKRGNLSEDEIIKHQEPIQQKDTMTETMTLKEILDYNSDLLSDIKSATQEDAEKNVAQGLDALAKVTDANMDPKKYEDFKNSDEYKNLTSKQKSILDATFGLQQAARDGKINDNDRRYLNTITMLGRDYKATLDRAHKKGGDDRENKNRQIISQRFVSQIRTHQEQSM